MALDPSPSINPVSVVIPCAGDPARLDDVLRRIPGWVDEVLLVDDGCSAETLDAACELVPDLRVIPNDSAPGRAGALFAGAQVAEGEIVVQVEPDGSAAPEEIHLFVGALLAGADYATGSSCAYWRRWAPVLIELGGRDDEVEAAMRVRAGRANLRTTEIWSFSDGRVRNTWLDSARAFRADIRARRLRRPLPAPWRAAAP